MISSLQTRLLLAVGVLAIATVAAVGFAARRSTHQEFERFQSLERVRDASGVDATLERVARVLDGQCCNAGAMTQAVALAAPEQAVFVFDARGTLVAAGGAGVDMATHRATYADGVLAMNSMVVEPGSSSGVSLSIKGGPVRSITLADGSAGSVHVVPLLRIDVDQPAAQFLGSVDRRLLFATAAVAALALLLTWAITRRIVGPIAELRNATRDLAGGQLSRRVEARGSDEVADLARAFNSMAGELERQQALRRNLVHDVAHELRTPLTALRCRVEAIVDGLVPDSGTSLRQVNEEVAHLSQLVSDLDELARAEARELTMAIADVGVGEVCRSAVRMAGLEGDARLILELDESLRARGDAVRVATFGALLLAVAGARAARACPPPDEAPTCVELRVEPYDHLGQRLTLTHVAWVRAAGAPAGDVTIDAAAGLGLTYGATLGGHGHDGYQLAASVGAAAHHVAGAIDASGASTHAELRLGPARVADGDPANARVNLVTFPLTFELAHDGELAALPRLGAAQIAFVRDPDGYLVELVEAR